MTDRDWRWLLSGIVIVGAIVKSPLWLLLLFPVWLGQKVE